MLGEGKRRKYAEHHYHCTDSCRTDRSSVLEFLLGTKTASVPNGVYFLCKSVRYSVSGQLHMDVRVADRYNHLSSDLLPDCLFGRPMDFFASLAPEHAPKSYHADTQSDGLWWILFSCGHFGSAYSSQLLRFSVYVNLGILGTQLQNDCFHLPCGFDNRKCDKSSRHVPANERAISDNRTLITTEFTLAGDFGGEL